jgi:DivIVA domain-containing protein
VSEPAIESMFERALRGYDTNAVSALLAEVTPALRSSDTQLRHRALDQLRQRRLPVAMRGYNKRQVEDYLEWVATQLTTQPPQQ